MGIYLTHTHDIFGPALLNIYIGTQEAISFGVKRNSHKSTENVIAMYNIVLT